MRLSSCVVLAWCLSSVVACTDLQTANGRRVSDNHVLSGRPADQGGPLLSENASRFESRSAHLQPLGSSIDSRLGFFVDVADLEVGVFPELRGLVRAVGPNGSLMADATAGPSLITGAGTALPVGDIGDLGAQGLFGLVLANATLANLVGQAPFTVGTLSADLNAACSQSPLFRTMPICAGSGIGNLVGGLADAQQNFDHLVFQVRGVEASWKASSNDDRCDKQLIGGFGFVSPLIFCPGTGGELFNQAACDGVCFEDENGTRHCATCDAVPKSDGTSECSCTPAGCDCTRACRFDNDCSTDADCAPGARCLNRQCNVIEINECGPKNPVLNLRTRLGIFAQQSDDGLFEINADDFVELDWSEAVFDVRIQPRICGGCSGAECRVPPGPIYTPDGSASNPNALALSELDVRANVVHVSNNLNASATFSCALNPLIEDCDELERQIEDGIDASLASVATNLGRLLETLINPPRLQVVPIAAFAPPSGSLAQLLDATLCPPNCADNPIDANPCQVPDVACVLPTPVRLDLLEGLVRSPIDAGSAQALVNGDTAPTALGGPGGAWTDGSYRALQRGAVVQTLTIGFDWLNEINQNFEASCQRTRLFGCFFLEQTCRAPSPSPICPALLGGVTFPVPLTTIPVEQRTVPPLPALGRFIEIMPALGAGAREFFTKPLPDGQQFSQMYFCGNDPRCREGDDEAIFEFLRDRDDDCVAERSTPEFPVRDNCPDDANVDQADRDGDDIGDICDSCPDDRNASTASNVDRDRDGLGNICDCDSDGDGCPNRSRQSGAQTVFCQLAGHAGFDANPDDPSRDRDNDGDADDCDGDNDNDGQQDGFDNCPDVPNIGQADLNGDGEGDACDLGCSPNGVRLDPDCPGSPLPVTTEIFQIRGGLSPFQCLAATGKCTLTAGLDWCDPRVCRREASATSIGVFLAGDPSPVWLNRALDLGFTSPFAGQVVQIADRTSDSLRELVLPLPREASCSGAQCRPNAGALVALDAATGERLWDYRPLAADAEFGSSVVSDGTRLFAGAPGAKNLAGVATGAVFVIDVSGPQPVLVDRFYGPNANERFGASVSLIQVEGVTVGVLAGAPNASPNLMREAGRIYAVGMDGEVFRAFDGPIASAHMGDAPAAFVVPNPQDRAGAVVAGLPTAYGSKGAVVSYTFGGSMRNVVIGKERNARLGERVLAGDFDGSGVVRVAASEPAGNGGKGRVAVYTAGLLEVVSAKGPYAASGVMALTAPGDFDGDGVLDLAIGMQGLTGAGPFGGWSQWSFDQLPAPPCAGGFGGCREFPQPCYPTKDYNLDGIANCAPLASDEHKSLLGAKAAAFFAWLLSLCD
jgi:hypothetical protein